MATDWHLTQLGRVGKWLSGGTPSLESPEFWNGSIPWASAKDMKRFELWDTEDHITEKGLANGSRAAEPGNILLVVRGMILAHTFPVAIAMTRMAFNQDIKAIRCHPHVDPRFLAHWLVGESARILTKVTDTSHGTKRFDVRHLARHPLPLPPLVEQQAIARILDAVDAALDRTRKAVEKAKALRKGLVQVLLQRGLDERGRVRDPQMSPGQFHLTPVGRVPIAWTISSVSAEFDLATGFTLGEHRRPRMNKRRYLRVANVQRERIVMDDVMELEASESEMEGRCLEENDLLVVEGHANPYEIGRCALVRSDAVGLTFQNHLFRLRSRGASPVFGCHWLNGDFAKRYWRRKCGTSSGLNTINQRMLKTMPVVVPCLGEQKQIVAILDSADQRVRAEHDRLQATEKLKRGLMHDLLTGCVRVPLPTDGTSLGGSRV